MIRSIKNTERLKLPNKGRHEGKFNTSLIRDKKNRSIKDAPKFYISETTPPCVDKLRGTTLSHLIIETKVL